MERYFSTKRVIYEQSLAWSLFRFCVAVRGYVHMQLMSLGIFNQKKKFQKIIILSNLCARLTDFNAILEINFYG